MLRQVGDGVEPASQPQEPAEEVRAEAPRDDVIAVPRHPGARADHCRLEPLRSLHAPDGRLGVLEGVRPCRVRRFELEREVVRERDLEQHFARASRIAEAVEERQRAPIVRERLLVRVQVFAASPASRR